MTTREILDRIAELEKKINILENKTLPINVPKGSRKVLPYFKAGHCIVCGLEHKKENLIIRCAIQTKSNEIRGYIVCRFCSPYIKDYELERYSMSITQWPRRWINGSINIG